MANRPEVEWVGLKETAAALKALPTTLERKTLSRELKKVALVVADAARKRVPVKSGDAAASISARSTAQSATVVGGKGKVAYYGWLDFGTRSPREGNTRAAGPWTGSGRGPHKGRFIYPAIDEKWRDIINGVGDAVDNAAREVGFH